MLVSQSRIGGEHTAIHASKQALGVGLVEMNIALGLADEGFRTREAVEPLSDTSGDVFLGFPVFLEAAALVDRQAARDTMCEHLPPRGKRGRIRRARRSTRGSVVLAMRFLELLVGKAHTAVRANDHAWSARVVHVVAVIDVLALAGEGRFTGEAVQPVSDTGGDVRLGLSVFLESSDFVDREAAGNAVR